MKRAAIKFFHHIFDQTIPLPPTSLTHPSGCTLHTLQSPLDDTMGATDGSYHPLHQKGAAAFFISPQQQWASRYPGKQSSDRSEAFGLLMALTILPSSGPYTLYTDCSSLIQSVERILRSPDPRDFKRIANFSIIKTCADLISSHAAAHSPITLLHVPSHTNATTPQAIKNNHADTKAKQECLTPTGSPSLHECYQNLPSHYLCDKDSIIETKTYSSSLIQDIHARMSIAFRHLPLSHFTRGFGPSPLVWPEAFSIPKTFTVQKFHTLLRSGSLPTPRNLFTMATKRHLSYSLRRAFPSDQCPLCHSPDANEHHCLCTCTSTLQARRAAITKAHQLLLQALFKANIPHPPLPVSLYTLWLAPAQIQSFQWGRIPISAQQWASPLSPSNIQYFGLLLSKSAHSLYHSIWLHFSSSVSRRGWSERARYQFAYNCTSRPSQDPIVDLIEAKFPLQASSLLDSLLGPNANLSVLQSFSDSFRGSPSNLSSALSACGLLPSAPSTS